MATATDGQRAHDILLGFEPLSRKGACWYYVWQAYAAAGASTSMGSTPTAYKGWQATQGKHPGDMNPPPGAAIWLGRRYSDGNMDGDVFIAGGTNGDQSAATDQPTWYQTGLVSIQGRMNLTGREYLGWSDHVLDCPIIMGGSTPPAGNQRTTGANGANQRTEPNTQVPVANFIAPNVVGTFDGWIHGEAVEGNDVWYRGANSGLWSWSGGFTDTGTHDLADLNPASIGPQQRQVVPNASANQRQEPSTSSPAVNQLAPGTVGDFDGWINGETVQGQPVWFRGAHSGLYSWAGGFTDQGTHDLADLNTPTPPDPSGAARTAVPDGAKVRSSPYTSSAQIGFIDGGASMEMTAWTMGEVVQGNGVWFQHALGWSWSGGFTSTSTEGIPEVSPPDPTPEPSDLNPLGLPEYEPVYPRAIIGLAAPLGFTDCQNPVTRAPRTSKGTPPNQVATSGVIDRFIIHWAWPHGDDTRFFSTCNDRGSCPTQYIAEDATAREFIRPGAKPASTGKDWNWRSWAVEVEPQADDSITDAQVDEIVEQIVFLAEHDGSTLDGAPVDFQIDAEHVIDHRTVDPSNTCPGDFLHSHLPAIIAEAKRRYDERHPDPEPGDSVSIARADAERMASDAEFAAGVLRAALAQ